MHFVLQTDTAGNFYTRLFYHIGTNHPLAQGLAFNLKGNGTGTGYAVNIVCGDLISTVYLNGTTVVSDKKPHHFIVRYDGTINTSWQDRFSVFIDGIKDPLTVENQYGSFPADILQPPVHVPARLWNTINFIYYLSISEIIFWDRAITDTEIQTLYSSARNAYQL